MGDTLKEKENGEKIDLEKKDVEFEHDEWYMRTNSQVEIDSKLLRIYNWSEGEVCAGDGKVGIISLVVTTEL